MEVVSIKININRASIADLRCIKGIGIEKAKHIYLQRFFLGKYRSYKQLERVYGVSKKSVCNIKKYITFLDD